MVQLKTNDNYAIDGTSNSTVGDSYGTTGWTFGDNTNYAIYGNAAGGTTNYAGYFEGDVFYTGTLSGPSDKKLKENITNLSSTKQKLISLPVYSYTFKNIEGMNLPKGMQYGFIAQEIEALFPNLVKQEVVPKYRLSTEILPDGTPVSKKEKIGEEHIKSVNYIGLIPVLSKTIQEQEATILSLEERIEALEEKLK